MDGDICAGDNCSESGCSEGESDILSNQVELSSPAESNDADPLIEESLQSLCISSREENSGKFILFISMQDLFPQLLGLDT